MTTYIRDPCFHDAISLLKNEVEKYSNEKNLEIEIRLGYLEENEFKTDIGKDFFNKIKKQLEITSEINNSWTKTEEQTDDYFYNGMRLSINDNDTVCIQKTKLASFDFIFEGSGFDLRVSFSTEIPSESFEIEKSTYKRKKQRTSFLYKDLSYDLSIVQTVDNTIQNYHYEVELESKKLDLTKMTSNYFIHDMLLKIKDMISMCEEIDDEPIVSFIK